LEPHCILSLRRLFLATGNWLLATALIALSGSALALDREAFTFTDYNLTAKIDPGFHVLRSMGTVTLRNDSGKPQRIAVLQISSSLQWESIRILPTVSTEATPAAPTDKEKSNGKPLQYLVQPYTSDMDHTGELSEAIVTLPTDIPPQARVQLQIAYSGVIEPSAGRWDRVGLPKDSSERNDWDRISQDFTGVRGFGYVAWYPVATEAASVSDQAAYGDTFSRFKSRHAATNFWLRACSPTASAKIKLLTNGIPRTRPPSTTDATCQDVVFSPLGAQIPILVVASLTRLDADSVQIWHQPQHAEVAKAYVEAARNVRPLVTEWFGEPRSVPTLIELPDPAWSPFESGTMLFTALQAASAGALQNALVHPVTHTALRSDRLWIFEGAAHFAQALEREQQAGRPSAISSMQQQYTALAQVDKDADPNRSLITTYDELLFRSKGMAVFWMLRDLVGDAALQAALKKYDAAQDKEPSYFQKLLEAESKKDLEWFFDDWVYRDRGLPDFKVNSVYTRQILHGGYLATITVENLGGAAAEIPIAVHFEHGDVRQRLVVKAHEKASARVEVATPPLEVTVNDGGVPESDTSNNTYTVPPPSQQPAAPK
jgi:hypothetical protein